MKRTPIDGRQFAPEFSARLHTQDGHVHLLAPTVGLWRDAPAPGSLVTPGGLIGELEILGVRHRLRAPEGAAGVVMERPGPRLARQPVAYGDLMLQLDPDASPATAGAAASASSESTDARGQTFVTPLSGRFYARPGPGEPAFVNVGDVIEVGQAVALLEVMKTFNRIAYGGEGLPTRARVLSIEPTDEDDVEEGDVLLRLEPA